MKIGLTYDLRDDYLKEGYSLAEVAEFDRVDTIEFLEQALQKLGHTTERIGHARSLMAKLLKGDRWDLVFNIAEGMYGYGREALIPVLLDAYQINYTFSDPLVMTASLHKAAAKKLVRDAGIPTPGFALVENENDIAKIDLPYPLFAKPVAEGTSKGVTPASRIDTKDTLKETCLSILKQFKQPVLVETFLPGREFTVGILGTGEKAEVVAILEIHLKEADDRGVYSFDSKEECETRVEYLLADDKLAKDSAELALKVWRSMGCRDAGRVDVRADGKGVPHFIEVNPLAGLHPEHSDLPIMCNLKGIQYLTLIEKILSSALSRNA